MTLINSVINKKSIRLQVVCITILSNTFYFILLIS